MGKVVVICANGFEEIEALAVVDVLRRGQVDVDILSIQDTLTVTGSRNIQIIADKKFTPEAVLNAEMVVLPGGVVGTENLASYKPLLEALHQLTENTFVAAICAAPSVLAQEGLLDQKKATSNPGYMDVLLKHPLTYSESTVVRDGNITTSRGMGTSIPFALELLGQLTDEATVNHVKESIVYDSLTDYVKQS